MQTLARKNKIIKQLINEKDEFWFAKKTNVSDNVLTSVRQLGTFFGFFGISDNEHGQQLFKSLMHLKTKSSQSPVWLQMMAGCIQLYLFDKFQNLSQSNPKQIGRHVRKIFKYFKELDDKKMYIYLAMSNYINNKWPNLDETVNSTANTAEDEERESDINLDSEDDRLVYFFCWLYFLLVIFFCLLYFLLVIFFCWSYFLFVIFFVGYIFCLLYFLLVIFFCLLYFFVGHIFFLLIILLVRMTMIIMMVMARRKVMIVLLLKILTTKIKIKIIIMIIIHHH